jgi:hypothetical protein
LPATYVGVLYSSNEGSVRVSDGAFVAFFYKDFRMLQRLFQSQLSNAGLTAGRTWKLKAGASLQQYVPRANQARRDVALDGLQLTTMDWWRSATLYSLTMRMLGSGALLLFFRPSGPFRRPTADLRRRSHGPHGLHGRTVPAKASQRATPDCRKVKRPDHPGLPRNQ